jgi:hypothetical protein
MIAGAAELERAFMDAPGRSFFGGLPRDVPGTESVPVLPTGMRRLGGKSRRCHSTSSRTSRVFPPRAAVAPSSGTPCLHANRGNVPHRG